MALTQAPDHRTCSDHLSLNENGTSVGAETRGELTMAG
jgi:hypothetical protein